MRRRAGWPPAWVFRRRARHLRPWQRRRHWAGPDREPRLPLHSRAQRAGRRPHGLGLRQNLQPLKDLRLHLLHRTRRHQYDYRRRPGDDQPSARAAFARRHFCPPQRLARPATTRIALHAGHRRERLLQAGVSLLGPHLPARAAHHGAARSDARVTSPSDCGAVTLALPQDVQAEAYDFPRTSLAKRVWLIRRPAADSVSFERARHAIAHSRKPLIVAGGGVLFSEASEALAALASRTGIPVAETQAGKGSLPYDHPQCVGAVGATGGLAANRLARDADLIIGVGTRYSDFTSASMTAFQNPEVRFVNINTAEFDAYKVSAIPVVADAKAALQR